MDGPNKPWLPVLGGSKIDCTYQCLFQLVLLPFGLLLRLLHLLLYGILQPIGLALLQLQLALDLLQFFLEIRLRGHDDDS